MSSDRKAVLKEATKSHEVTTHLHCCDRLFQPLNVPCHYNHIGTFRRQLDGYASAHAIRAASEQDSLKRETVVSALFVWFSGSLNS